VVDGCKGVSGSTHAAAGSAQALATAVDALLQRRAEWPRLRQAGRSFVETERNWTASVARYAPVYDRLAPTARADAHAIATA
jgi:glycosyltransferase involved in cell wall biosynthesis